MVVHIITMVPSLIPKEEGELKASPKIQELREALKKHGGQPILPILLGDATVKASPALDPALGPFDACITRHASIKAYITATQSHLYQVAAKDTNILTFGFSNNGILVNFVFPALKKVYNLFQKVDCEAKADKKIQYDWFQASGERGIDNYKRKIDHKVNQACYLLSLTTKSELPEAKEADREHVKSWLPAAFSYNLKKTLGGRLVSLNNGPKMFGEVSVYEYPTRELYVDWMESEYHTKLHEDEQKFILDRFVQICIPIYG
jgi:hypothetical protein